MSNITEKNKIHEKHEEMSKMFANNYNRWLGMLNDKKYDDLINEITTSCKPFLFVNNLFPEYDNWDDITPYDNLVAEKYGVPYINASFVNRFIACQEPKKKYVDVFYDFLSKTDIKLIITLKEKLGYFSDDHKIEELFNNDNFVVTKYKVNDKVYTHVHCKIWIDHAIITIEQMDELQSYVKKHPEFYLPFNTLVHCWAGVGRTGTFIMYSLLSDLECKITPEIFLDTLLELRICRHLSVQNGKQLGFIAKKFLNH